MTIPDISQEDSIRLNLRNAFEHFTKDGKQYDRETIIVGHGPVTVKDLAVLLGGMDAEINICGSRNFKIIPDLTTKELVIAPLDYILDEHDRRYET